MATQLKTLGDVVPNMSTSAVAHPDMEDHIKEVTDIAVKYGLLDAHDNLSIKKYRGLLCLVPLTMPQITKEKMNPVSIFFLWVSFVDDHCDETDEPSEVIWAYLTKCLNAMKTGMIPENTPFWNYSKFVHETIREVIQDEEVFCRFITTTGNYLLQGTFVSVQYWNQGKTADLAEYMDFRKMDSSVQPTEILSEVCGECVLPTHLFHAMEFAQLRATAEKHIALLNDLVSYTKECVVAGNSWNMVKILKSSKDLTLDEAVHETVLMVNAQAAEFERLSAVIKADPRLASDLPIIEAYVPMLKQLVVGHVAFAHQSSRYSDPLLDAAVRDMP